MFCHCIIWVTLFQPAGSTSSLLAAWLLNQCNILQVFMLTEPHGKAPIFVLISIVCSNKWSLNCVMVQTQFFLLISVNVSRQIYLVVSFLWGDSVTRDLPESWFCLDFPLHPASGQWKKAWRVQHYFLKSLLKVSAHHLCSYSTGWTQSDGQT